MPRYKLILDADSGRFEMYDLTTDKLELTDVYAELSGVRPEWSRSLMRLARENAAALPAPTANPERLAQLRALGYLESTSQ